VPTLVAKYDENVASSVEVRGHRMIIDVPPEMGGEDRGPTPIEILAASLGSCIMYYLSRWCREAKIDCQGMEVKVDYEVDQEKHCVSELNASIKLSSDFPQSRRKAALRVANQCTVHNTLCHTPNMEIKLI